MSKCNFFSSQLCLRLPFWALFFSSTYLFFFREDSLDPSFWSKVCLHNMAKLGEEATTMRRILESLFRYFDEGCLWSTENSIAFPVLRDLQFLMEISGMKLSIVYIQSFPHDQCSEIVLQSCRAKNTLYTVYVD